MAEFAEVSRPEPRVVAGIIDLEKEVFGAGAVDSWSLPPLIRHGKVFVMQEGEHILAVVEFMRDFSDTDTAYLYGLAVRAEARRRGLARLLLQKSFRRLAVLGMSRVCLTVAPDNRAALRLYVDKLGFEHAAYYPNEYGPETHRCLLVRSIKEDGNG